MVALGILKHMTFRIPRTPIFQSTIQLSQLPGASTERCSLKIVVIKFLENKERW